jgi:type I restriction enzyme S subunit
MVQPWHEQQFANESESDTLAALRDTLLPRLLSGELRVGDAERISVEVR